MSEPLFRTRDLTKRYGGLTAVGKFGMELRRGELVGLIGPNGAGKTTLFNVITGLQLPEAGRVLLDGRDVTHLGVHKRARLGISRTFQKLEPFNSLSARENVIVAAEMASRRRRLTTDPRRTADEILDRVGLGAVADITVATLPTGTARLVELARALARGPRLLLLDEVSSGLDERETAAVGDLLTDLVTDRDLAVLLVEHDMSFVMRMCSHIHVLDFGEIIAEGTPDEVQRHERVRHAYLGADHR